MQTALEKAGWCITHDSLAIDWNEYCVLVDFGIVEATSQSAEPTRAVELKSLDLESGVVDIRNALGQYLLYRAVIRDHQLDLELYLAITNEAFRTHFNEFSLGGLVRREYDIWLLVFDPHREEIIQWLK